MASCRDSCTCRGKKRAAGSEQRARKLNSPFSILDSRFSITVTITNVICAAVAYRAAAAAGCLIDGFCRCHKMQLSRPTGAEEGEGEGEGEGVRGTAATAQVQLVAEQVCQVLVGLS